MNKNEELSQAIATVERQISEAKSEVAKKALNGKLERLKEELKSGAKTGTSTLATLSSARKSVRKLASKDFKALIEKLSAKPEYAFLKGYSEGKLKDDLARVAKPMGYRFVGDNTKKPTIPQIKKGLKNGTVYYEARPIRSDVSRVVQLGEGGSVSTETLDLKFYNVRGQVVESGKVIIDYDNETITLGSGKKYKVEPDREYTYRFLKTKIRAAKGIKGLSEFLKEINAPKKALNTVVRAFIDSDESKMADGGKIDDLQFKEIASMSNVRETAIKDWAKANNLSSKDVSNIMMGLGRKQIKAGDFSTAVVGNPNNKYSKEIIEYAKANKGYKMENGGNIESSIDKLYEKAGFINDDMNWQFKLLEMIQDGSSEAHDIYQGLNADQKEEVLQELYDMDNDMGSNGEGNMETSRENLEILLYDAEQGHKYGKGGGVSKRKTKGDIGKSGTQYGYTLKEYEAMAEKNGLFVSPSQYWKSQEGTKDKDSFGRTQTVGERDKQQVMMGYGYRIAIGLDLGSDKIPASAKKYVEENNLSKFAMGGNISSFNWKNFTLKELNEALPSDVEISSISTPMTKDLRFSSPEFKKMYSTKNFTISEHGETEISKGSENIYLEIKCYDAQFRNSEEEYEVKIYSKENHKGLKEVANSVIEKMKHGGSTKSHDLDYYSYETAKVTISWRGKTQPFGFFKSAREAFNKINEIHQTNAEKADYVIVTPDGNLNVSDFLNKSKFAMGGGVDVKIKFRKLAKSNNFDIVVAEGRYEVELDANDKVKSIVHPNGNRHKASECPIYNKYKKEINHYIMAKYAEGGNIDNSYLGRTQIGKSFYGWKAETSTTKKIKGYDWQITTMKRYGGELVSTATGGKSEKQDGYSTFEYSPFEDPSYRLVSSKPKMVNEKAVTKQHEEALKIFIEKMNEMSGDKMATGGAIEKYRLFNFLSDDLATLKEAIKISDKQEIERFFSYWGQHLKSLKSEANKKMFNFLSDDLATLKTAIKDNDQEEIDKFFSYWGQHLESIKYATGGKVGEKTYNVMHNVGKSKYVVNFHNGVKTYSDGSAFFDIEIFKNLKGLKAFIKKLESEGYKKQMATGGGINSSQSFKGGGEMTTWLNVTRMKSVMRYKDKDKARNAKKTLNDLYDGFTYHIVEENDEFVIYRESSESNFLRNLNNNIGNSSELIDVSSMKKEGSFDSHLEALKLFESLWKKGDKIYYLLTDKGIYYVYSEPKRSHKAFKEIMATGGSVEDKLPPSKTYGENLQKAMEKFDISNNEARKRYGLYTIKQWSDLLGEKMENGGEVGDISKSEIPRMQKITKLKGLYGYMPSVNVVYYDSKSDKFYFQDFEGDYMELRNISTLEQLHKFLKENNITLDKKMATGGSIPDNYEGRTPEDIWNNLSHKQRTHFLFDHIYEIEAYKNIDRLPTSEIRKATKSEWSTLDSDIKNKFTVHIAEGQYATGGSVGGKKYSYLPNEDISKIVLKSGQIVDNKRILDGAYIKSKGATKSVEKYSFPVGSVVWDKTHKRYGVVLNNFGNDLEGDRGEIRLDSDGVQPIFEYDKKSNRTEKYNLVPYGSKEDKGDGDLLDIKESGQSLIDGRKEKGDEEYVKYYEDAYGDVIAGKIDGKPYKTNSVNVIGETSTGKSIYQKYNSIPDLNIKELKEASDIHSKFAKKAKTEEEKQTALKYSREFMRMANEEKFAKGLGKFATGGSVSPYIDEMTEKEIMAATVVYDNGGETLDRYTVFTPDGSVYGMSETASGFNQYAGDESEIEKGSHLGKRLKTVPKGIRLAILDRMKEEFKHGGSMYKKGGNAGYTYIPNEDISKLIAKDGKEYPRTSLLDGAYITDKVRTPKMSRTQFEDETFEYGQGGGIEEKDKGKLSFKDWMESKGITVYKRTYYWVADDGGNDYMYVADTKNEVLDLLKKEWSSQSSSVDSKMARGGGVDYQDIKKEKQKMTTELFKECGVFFAFSDKQFEENKTPLKEGEKYVSIGGGGYLPKGQVDAFMKGMKAINSYGKQKVKKGNLQESEILYELQNHECFYTGDISDVVDLFEGTYTEKQIRDVYNKHREANQEYALGGEITAEEREQALKSSPKLNF
jgi:hypothetical protein